MPKVPDSHLAARRQQILEAALQCFARKGVQATSMQDIFAESGLSPGGVYRYFKSKQEIIDATFEASAASLEAMFPEPPAGSDPVANLRGFSEGSFGMLDGPEAQTGMRAGVAFLAEAVRDEGLRERYRGAMTVVTDYLTRRMQDLQAAGGLDPEMDPAQTARVLYALFEGCRIQKLVDPTLDVPTFVRTMRALLDLGRQR